MSSVVAPSSAPATRITPGCVLCGSRDARAFHAGLAPKYDGLVVDARVSFVVCAGCGLVYQHPRLTTEHLDALYTQGLRSHMGAATPTTAYLAYASQVAATDFAWLERAWPSLGTGELPRHGRLLEIGCATGRFLARARERGWSVAGVEPEREYSEFGRRQDGLEIRTGFAEDVALTPASFDLIACLHVVEHVPHPVKFLEIARTLLRPGGHLYVVVPNLRQYDVSARHPELFDLLHLFAFSRNSLARTLQTARFEPVVIDDGGRQLAALARAETARVVAGAAVDDPDVLLREERRYRRRELWRRGWRGWARAALVLALGPAQGARLADAAGRWLRRR
jgi:2-polyprenyl-3-methyl-5-hydroxy-6-metoxy-1,4-benzoquinol methylase